MSEFEAHYKQLMYGLSLSYCQLLQKSEREFNAEIVEPMLASNGIDIDAEFESVLALPRKKMLPLDLVRLSCAYATTAYREHKAGEEHTAWITMCDANYWWGMLDGSKLLPDLVDQVSMGRAQSGGSTSNKTRNIVMVYALQELERLLEEDPTRYTSATHAATSLRKRINEFLDSIFDDPVERTKHGLDSSVKPDPYSVDTIRRWFKHIEFKNKQEVGKH